MENLSVQFIQLSTAQLQDLISEGVRKELDLLKLELLKKDNSEDLLSREEASKYLGINLSTLWRWTKKGNLPAHAILGKTYYKRNEILSSLKELK